MPLWEKVKITTLTGVRKKWITILMDDFEGSRLMEEIIANMVKIAGELVLEVEPEELV